MQSVSSSIWTRVAVFISYDDNHYTTSVYLTVCSLIPNLVSFVNVNVAFTDDYL